MLLVVVAVFLSLKGLVNAECPGVVSRQTWDALSPMHVQYLTRPVNIVIIAHTVSDPCTTDQACEEMMRALQNYFMDDLKYWDTGSSFYVGGNGKIYEGVGWMYVGAHTYGYNSRSIAISFIGNYNRMEPTTAQLQAVKDLLSCGVQQGHLTQDHVVVGHRQLISTDSPGRKLYNVIRRWPEWVEDVSFLKK